MMIQSGYGTQAYSGVVAASVQRLEGRAAAAGIAEMAKYADQVSLSSAGKALAASESASTEKLSYLPYQERILANASADRAYAERMASDITYARSAIIFDLPDYLKDSGPTGGIDLTKKLSTSGRIVDDAFKEEFEREAPIIDAQRRALYESEKAKGTDPVEILRKLYDFDNAQSYEYREATGAGWRGDEVAASNQSGKTSGAADLQTLRLEIDARRHALIESEKAKAAERLEMLTSLIKAGRHALIVPEKDEKPDPLEILRKMTDSTDKQPQEI